VGDGTQERIVKNNLTFREANERISARAAEYEAPLERVPFLCECPREDCTEIVRLTHDEYQRVREEPTHFIAADGHEIAEEPVGRIISREEGYVIVGKNVNTAR
jgi:hypothetical protein